MSDTATNVSSDNNNKRKGRRKLGQMENPIQGISKPAIRRLSKKSGISQMASSVCNDVREAITEHIEKVLKDALLYSEHANRKTVTLADVSYALKRQGRPSA